MLSTSTKAPRAAIAAGWLSVTTMRPNSPHARSRSTESPGKTPWVATASIEIAPASRYAAAALISEPPVRIMSS